MVMREELIDIFMDFIAGNEEGKELGKKQLTSAFQVYSKKRAFQKYHKLLEAFSSLIEQEISYADKGKAISEYISSDRNLEIVWESLRSCMLSPSKNLAPYILAQISVKLIFNQISRDVADRVIYVLESLKDVDMYHFLEDYEVNYSEDINIHLKSNSKRGDESNMYKLKLNSAGIASKYIATRLGASSDIDADFYINKKRYQFFIDSIKLAKSQI